MKIRNGVITICIILGSVVGLLLLYILMAFGLSAITVNKNNTAKGDIEIYILTNGVHTDIVVPAKNQWMDWTKQIKFEHITTKDTIGFKYLAMGWGDKGFYLETPEWADLKASVAFKAATGMGSTAMHTTYYTKMKVGNDCKKIMISNEDYLKLIDYIVKSFQKDKYGNFININTTANYGKTDAFYEANGSYSIFHTCNSWANNALKYSGQKCCFWTPFDKVIFNKYND
jgi:uncharacterized protein (TIGR02117 family)